MPLWRVFHPPGAWNDEEKTKLSQAITKLYSDRGLPPFYVVVIYTAVSESDGIYVGGKINNKFVRITIDQIARDSTLLGLKQQKGWLDLIDKALAPYIKERGFDWEYHIDSTPRTLWRIQGIDPPDSESETEKLWFDKNAPLPYY